MTTSAHSTTTAHAAITPSLGPKIRVKAGLVLPLTMQPLYTRNAAEEFQYCYRLVEKLSDNLQKLFVYPNQPRPEHWNGYCMWLEIRESVNNGPWESAEALEAHLAELRVFYAALEAGVKLQATRNGLGFKLLVDETEPMPNWWREWIQNQQDVRYEVIPDMDKLFQR